MLVGASCEQRDPIEDGSTLEPNTKIAIIGLSADDAQFPFVVRGAQHYAEPFPSLLVEAFLPEFGGIDDPDALLDRALAENPGAIVFWTPRGTLPEHLLDRAVSAVGYVVTAGQRPAGRGSIGHVQVSGVDAGNQLARAITNRDAGFRSMIVTQHSRATPFDTEVYQAFSTRVRGQQQVFVLKDVAMTDRGDPEANAIGDALTLYPRTRLVTTLRPDVWLESPKLALPGHVQFATLGATPGLWPALERGEAAFLCGPLDGEIGRAAARMAHQRLMSATDPEFARLVPTEVVTLESLADFRARYLAACGISEAEFSAPPASNP